MNFFQSFIALRSLTEREVRKFFRVWPQSLLSPALTLIIYIIIFKNLFPYQNEILPTFSYTHFIIPGLVIMGAITSSFDNVNLSFFNAKFRRTIDDSIVSPMSSSLILIGYILGGVFRGLIVSLITILISIFFVKIEITHPFLMIYIIISTCISFSALGFISSLLIQDFDELYFIPNFILLPLILLGGIFHTTDSLPSILQSFSLINPFTYLIDAIRYSFIGFKKINIFYLISITVISNLLLFKFSLYLFSLKIKND